MATVYLGLGSNWGRRRDNLEEAVWRLSSILKIRRLSSLYDSAAVGNEDQPRFLNMALEAQTALAPMELLKKTQEIERQMGRKPFSHNLPRPIDIDILFYDNQVINTQELSIPHPRITERAFVLLPLAEIAPHLVHPVIHKRVIDMLASLYYSPQEIIKYRE